MQKCRDCGETKPWIEFNKNKAKKSGYGTKCRECMKIYRHKHYRENKERLREEITTRKNYIKEWFREYKKTLSCSQCGFSHPAALDFHHTRDKENLVSMMASCGHSKQRILDEVAKCEILCANCHRIHHYEQ
jgi:uncharacterized Zn finger protein